MPAFPLVPVIVGPTGSGKTAVAIELAKQMRGEIISADSRQVYKYLDIGTAKPTLDEVRSVPHHFVSEVDPGETYTAGAFGIDGRERIHAILRRGKLPIVAGGSGLYIRALIDGLFDGPGADPEIREALEKKVAAGLTHELLEDLRRVDPVAAAKADITKPRRIIRALEVYYLTGKSISEHHKEKKTEIGFIPVQFGLMWERNELYRRIEQRCDSMIERGLLAEIEELEVRGYGRGRNALNTVGYAEGFAFRAGEISFAGMMRLFKQNSRRYAKRQLTWFRADRRIRWIKMKGEADVEGSCVEIQRRMEERCQRSEHE
jgi:tRNA dimethylallyltransferase